MRNINNVRLTKDNILSKISQENIFAAYFNIPLETVKHCIDSGELICSPIRDDTNPTVGFRYDTKGKLKMKDFSGVWWGDCFDAVATILSTIYDRQFDVSNKRDFIDILRHITFTFKDIYYGTEVDPIISASISNAIANIKRSKQIIEVVVRDWNKKDEEYWGQFGITLKLLNTNFIYPVEQYYINRKSNPHPKYFYTTKDPCYCYNLGVDRNNINNIKLYFPKRDKKITRFITNCNHLEGIYNLARDDYDMIIITKSTKDRLAICSQILKYKAVIGSLLHLHIGVINIPHETYKLRKIEIDWLNSKLSLNGCILSLMDNDATGINEANWIKTVYEIDSVFIPKRYNAKDFADCVKLNDDSDIQHILTTFFTYFNQTKRNELYRKFKESDNVPF